MAEFYTILTSIGLTKLVNAQLTADKLSITQIAVGDSFGSHYEPTQNLTSLKNEKWRGNVTNVSQDQTNPNWIVAEVAVPSTVGGWMIREVGLFDEDGDLIAIGKYPETYKPVAANGSVKDLIIRMIVEVNNASSVELKVDPTIITASRKYVNDNLEQLDNKVAQQLTGKASATETMQQLVPKKYVFGEQLAKLKYALSNPLEQFMSIVFIGDSITWGVGATGNPTDYNTGRDGTLSDIRDKYASKSWVNNFKRYIASKYLFNASATLSNWYASASGESIAEYKKETKLFPYGGDFTVSTSGTMYTNPAVATSANSLCGSQLYVNVESSKDGVMSLEFPFTGKEFTLSYDAVVNGMDYELLVDGESQGIYSTESATVTYDKRRTHTFNYVKNKLIQIKTVKTAYEGVQTLKVGGIIVNKTIKISNQGIIGATTRSYMTNMLEGNTKGDGVAISDEDKYLFVQLGTNDRIIVSGVAKGVNEYKNNLKALINMITQSDRDIVLMCANPAANENPATYSFNMQEVRNITYQVAKELGIDMVDNYSIFGDDSIANYTSDLLHLNDYGNTIVSRNLINALESSGIVPKFENNLENHENMVVSEVISTGRDVSVDGAQIVSGFSNIPKRLDIYAIVANSKVMSIGNKSGVSETCIAVLNDGNTNSIPASLMIGSSNSNYTRGNVVINADKTITINWTKVGSGGVGSSAIKIIAHYH